MRCGGFLESIRPWALLGGWLFFGLTELPLLRGASLLELEQAEKLYRAGALEQAKARLQLLLDDEEESDVEGAMVLRLLEIAVRQRNWQEAHRWEADPRLPLNAEAGFWKAQALMGRGAQAQGLAGLERLLVEDRGAWRRAAQLTLAASSFQAERFQEAEAYLEGLSWSEDGPEVDYLRARLAAASGERPRRLDAINRLERLRQNPGTLSTRWLESALIELAKLRFAEGQGESGEAVLRVFFERFPQSPHTREGFQRLTEGGAWRTEAQRDAWETWSSKQPVEFQDAFQFRLAQTEAALAGDGDPSLLNRALTRIERFPPSHPLGSEAAVLRAKWLLQAGNVGASVAFLDAPLLASVSSPSRRQQLEFLRGEALYRIGRTKEAHQAFSALTRSLEEPARILAAAHNQAVTAGIDDDEAFAEALRRIERHAAVDERDARIGDALLGRAVLLARLEDHAGQAVAGRLLGRLSTSESEEELHGLQGTLLRAELALRARPPRLEALEMLLQGLQVGLGETSTEDRRVSQQGHEAIEERMRYLLVCQAALLGRMGEIEQLAGDFAARYPDSALNENIRLRLAEAKCASMLPLTGATEVQSLAMATNGARSFRLQGLVIQAQNEARLGVLEQSIKTWAEFIGETEGELQLNARHHQALVLAQRGLYRETLQEWDPSKAQWNESVGQWEPSLAQWDPSLAQWDEILRRAPSLSLRVRVLAAKGEYLMLLGQIAPAVLREAVATLDQLLALPELPPVWRDQARYRKGVALLVEGKRTEAHTAFVQVLERFEERVAQGMAVGSESYQQALPWYYRAGFEALAGLEKREQWEAAALLADRLAAVSGERSQEAAERGARIRVTHWLFDERESPW